MTLQVPRSHDPFHGGVSISFVNAEGLIAAEVPALEGDTLNLPVLPIPRNKMLVAAETDA